MAIDSLVRLYDPRFPLSEIEPKPIDLNLPSIDKDSGSKELPEEIRAWLNFEEEELLKDRLLEEDWITIFDNYYQKSDRLVEERFATSFLASHALADRILMSVLRLTLIRSVDWVASLDKVLEQLGLAGVEGDWIRSSGAGKLCFVRWRSLPEVIALIPTIDPLSS
jgi:hypothetical protein